MTMRVEERLEIPERLAGRRLDQALAELLPEWSRSRLTQWIRQGSVRVDGRVMKPREKVWGGEQVVIEAEQELPQSFEPEAIPLRIVYQDEAILVIDKPAGLVVHPAAGNWSGTLQNALLHHLPGAREVPRAGIVHRLDKETSGLMVVACTPQAHQALVEQLQARSVGREYHAIVTGVPTGGGTIDAPVGRHPVDRKRMAVVASGRRAVTHYRVERRFRAHAHLRVRLETGRTHQIRVHLAHIRLPIVGDPVYGGRFRRPARIDDALAEVLRTFPRQALHAGRLVLRHPVSGEEMAWEAPLPDDMRRLLAALEAAE